jgi:phosphatidylserine decarboxylase
MNEIVYIDRRTKQRKKEQIYGHLFLKMFYGEGFFSRLFFHSVLPFMARISFFSRLYGFFQKSALSRFKVCPFIETFAVDASEFLDPVESFRSFNDFFIRRLKPSARPIVSGDERAVLPADGRYLVFENISTVDGFLVKGQKFSLTELLVDKDLAKRYADASMVIARLCPTDYHRFHFPCECVPGPAHLINGPLFSVNPLALRKNIHFLSENKRMVSYLETTHFGSVLYIEVGATCVGTIHQTYTAGFPAAKGDEKGYFSFGGSCIILLFEAKTIVFDPDLIEASSQKIETLGLFGQSLGRSVDYR